MPSHYQGKHSPKLSEELEALAIVLALRLKERRLGNLPPVKGHIIASAPFFVQKRLEWRRNNGKDTCRWVRGSARPLKPLTDVHVRKMVQHRRTMFNDPIASDGEGYSWAIKPEELNNSLDHLRERRAALTADIEALELAQKRLEPVQQLSLVI